jgi:hypothetical protein
MVVRERQNHQSALLVLPGGNRIALARAMTLLNIHFAETKTV